MLGQIIRNYLMVCPMDALRHTTKPERIDHFMKAQLSVNALNELKALFAQSDDEFHMEILEVLNNATPYSYQIEADTEIIEVIQDTLDELI